LSRPISLSAISILTVSYGVLSLIPKIVFLLPSEQSASAWDLLRTMIASGPLPLPLWLHFSHALISSVVWIIAGIFLWQGTNWARWLMIAWGLSVIFLTASVYGFSGSTPWKCGTYLIGIYFLLKQSSREYFAERARLKDV
jgi:hypothetical protein